MAPPTPQPSTGERSETTGAVSMASTEVVVDAPVAPQFVPGEATPVAPSSISSETNDPREGFVFPLVDPWYKISPLFPCKSLDFSFPVEDWDWTVMGSEVAMDRAWVPSLDEISEDIEPLCEVLRRWCPSTYTFFFAWGELTMTLEDIANHWMLPILGEHSFSGIELSAEEEKVAAALQRHSSTRLSDWLTLFVHREDISVRRAAFILYWLYRFPDFCNNLPLVYRWVGLKTRDHDLVAALDHEENVLLRPYGDDYPGFTCVSVFGRFNQSTSLIYDLRADDHRSLAYLSAISPGWLPILSATGETTTSTPDLAPFIKSRAFAHWEGEISRIMVLSDHRFGFNTSSMNAYWQRLTHSMVEYMNIGRGDKTPILSHRKPQTSNPCLSPPSQSAISYSNSQKLGFAEWDETRDGWIAYTIHLPGSWRESINIVEERLIMPSKRGKGSKRDIPVDPIVEKDPKKPAPSPKKTFSTKTQAGKKSGSAVPTLGREEESATPLSQAAIVSTTAPSRAKGVASGSSKSRSAAAPSFKVGKKSVASRPPKGQRKVGTSSSSSDKEPPSVAPAPSPSRKKKFVAPLFPFDAATRTRSKSGFKATRKPSISTGGVVIVEDSDMAVDDIVISLFDKDDPLTVAADQGDNMERSLADDLEADIGSTEGIHSFSSDTSFDIASSLVREEQVVFVGSAADTDDMMETGELNTESQDLAIVTHAGHSFEHRHGDSDAVDPDAVPLSFSVSQTILIGGVAGSGVPLSYVMEGISLFGTTPRLGIIPVGVKFRHPKKSVDEVLRWMNSAVDSMATPEVHGSIESAVSDGAQNEVAPASGEHLDNIGTSDTTHMSEDDADAGITGEITIASLPPRLIAGAGSSVGASTLDCLPYLQRLSTEHGNFTINFKLSAGLGGPMLSLLGSVMTAMNESNLENVTKDQILAWKSVIQDLMEVGFNLGFVIGRLRHIAQRLFGKRISNEVEALQHQIALLQDSLAMLTAYQEEMVSAGGTVLWFEHGRSLFDSLFD
uniref:Aminotransferase-like plant mobile domain-containing protein n=1 Tax=Fagus sylvatica TaxID=28930 RepID=A0A2N9H5E6_FAGSY